ncbi:MAG: hypothetical protein JWN25_300, partial [Verrucomicrobiales bacterium]|nr:hypothetical protein [Verrucomicrobiales bacterium]
RLIRNETDCGVALLICPRFLKSPYLELLPRDWYQDDPSELRSAHPPTEIRNFFAPV